MHYLKEAWGSAQAGGKETSDWEISADLPGKERQGKNVKGGNGEENKENSKQEGGKLKMEGGKSSKMRSGPFAFRFFRYLHKYEVKKKTKTKTKNKNKKKQNKRKQKQKEEKQKQKRKENKQTKKKPHTMRTRCPIDMKQTALKKNAIFEFPRQFVLGYLLYFSKQPW